MSDSDSHQDPPNTPSSTMPLQLSMSDSKSDQESSNTILTPPHQESSRQKEEDKSGKSNSPNCKSASNCLSKTSSPKTHFSWVAALHQEKSMGKKVSIPPAHSNIESSEASTSSSQSNSPKQSHTTLTPPHSFIKEKSLQCEINQDINTPTNTQSQPSYTHHDDETLNPTQEQQYYILSRLVFEKRTEQPMLQPKQVHLLEKKYHSLVLDKTYTTNVEPTFRNWEELLEYVIYRMSRYCFEDKYNENSKDDANWFCKDALYYDPISKSYPCMGDFPLNHYECYEVALTYVPSHCRTDPAEPVYLPLDVLFLIHTVRPSNIVWSKNGCIVCIEPLNREHALTIDVPLDMLPILSKYWYTLNHPSSNVQFYRLEGQYGFLTNLQDYCRSAFMMAYPYLDGLNRFMKDYNYVPGRPYNRQQFRDPLNVIFTKVGGNIILYEIKAILDKRFKPIPIKGLIDCQNMNSYLKTVQADLMHQRKRPAWRHKNTMNAKESLI